MTKAVKRPMAPRDARNETDIRAMPRDNVESGDFWMITDGCQVSLAQQQIGKSPTASIGVPRKVFDAFVDWYMSGRWVAPRRTRTQPKTKRIA